MEYSLFGKDYIKIMIVCVHTASFDMRLTSGTGIGVPNNQHVLHGCLKEVRWCERETDVGM